MNALKEILLFAAIVGVAALWIAARPQPDVIGDSMSPSDYAVISRTNIIAVKGPSQVFFPTRQGAFLLFDWERDDFYEPEPYPHDLDPPSHSDVIKVIGDHLLTDAAANLAYINDARHEAERQLARHKETSRSKGDTAGFADHLRRIRADLTFHDNGELFEYYEQTFDNKPRLAIVYYDNGQPKKIKHFNRNGQINGGAYEFYESGRIKTYNHFFEGVPWGPHLKWDENGRLIEEEFMTGLKRNA